MATVPELRIDRDDVCANPADRSNRSIVDSADAEPAEDEPPVPILVVPLLSSG